VYAVLSALLPVALGIAINPASIVTVILLLTSNQGRAKGLAFLAGWLIGLITMVFAIGVLVSIWSYRWIAPTQQFTTWVLLIVGMTLILMASIQWRQRPPPDAEFLPIKWLRVMPQATSFMALSAGLFFGLFNMKNLLLTAVAILIIGEASFALDERLMMVLIFLVLATLGIAAPVFVSTTQNERAGAILADWEYKLGSHNVTISCVVLVIIAVQMLLAGVGRS
jgi:MFS family permease